MYFVTFCTVSRDPFLSRIVDGQVRLLPAGRRVEETWTAVLANARHAELVALVIMPNHVHAIVALDIPRRGRIPRSSDADAPALGTGRRSSLLSLIGTVKSYAAAAINRDRNTPSARVWQRSFHDHIIRDAADLLAHLRYIERNPQSWRSV
jgi:putative transposase